jgi:hypothetical protein
MEDKAKIRIGDESPEGIRKYLSLVGRLENLHQNLEQFVVIVVELGGTLQPKLVTTVYRGPAELATVQLQCIWLSVI